MYNNSKFYSVMDLITKILRLQIKKKKKKASLNVSMVMEQEFNTTL